MNPFIEIITQPDNIACDHGLYGDVFHGMGFSAGLSQ